MDNSKQPIVVGVDGSSSSTIAAEYAAALAVRRNRPLLLVHGYLYPSAYGALGFSPYSPVMPDTRDSVDAMMKASAEHLRQQYPDLDIGTLQVAAGGALALIEQSQRAELLVVGCRGLGGFAELLLGSVSSQVAAHADCPVIVIRPADTPPPADAPIIVGVDGSPESALAVGFGFTEAAARGVGVTVLNVYWVTAHLDLRRSGEELDNEAREHAGHLVSEAVRPWLDRYPDVPVTTTLLHHLNPEYQLAEASRGASLVVVGARGRGGFTGLLLGSVSQALVHHGHCPVAVVHAHRKSQ